MAVSITNPIAVVFANATNVAQDFTVTRKLVVYDVRGHITTANVASPARWTISSTAAAIITARTGGAVGLNDVVRPIAGTNAFTLANQDIATGGTLRCLGLDAGEVALIAVYCAWS